MPTTYAQPGANDRVHELMIHALETWHTKLHKAEVRVAILFAANKVGPALKHGGDPVLAKIKVVGLDLRILTGFDALLKIDEKGWEHLEADCQLALIDHELSHLRIMEKDGRIRRDDIGRPRLRTVPGDWCQSDGFDAVVRRHGLSAVEAISSWQAHLRVTDNLNAEKARRETSK